MKRLLFVIIAFVFILAVYGNSSSRGKEASEDSKTINAGTEGTYVPFSFHDRDGRSTSCDIDVIKVVAREEDLKFKFNETSWDSMFIGLDTGRFDIIANQVGTNPDREKKYKFSRPCTFSSAVLVICENEKDIKDFDDVKDKKLTQTFTSNYGKLAKDKGADITKVNGFNRSMDLLLSRRIDGIFDDSLSYLGYKKQKSNAKIKAIKGNAERSRLTFAFSKKADGEAVQKFNDGLKKVEESGELAKIGKERFGRDVSKSK